MAKKNPSLTTQTVSLTVNENSTATPIGIPAPKDSQYSSTRLTIKVTSLPTDGTVLLSGGKTVVYVGETLTVAQLTGLLFKPNPGVFSQSSRFSYKVTDPSGASATGTATLAIATDKLPPVTTSASLTVAENSAATAIGIAAPTDPNYAAAQLSVTIGTLPTDGAVLLSDGVTAVNAGETLSVSQLTSLLFKPASGFSGLSSTLTYTVTDPSGLTAAGTAVLSIATNGTSQAPTPPPAATADPIPAAPSVPPALPVSGAPNNWLSTYTAGATLSGDPSKNNQLAANATGVTLIGGPLDDTFIVYDPTNVVVGNGGVDSVETWGSGYTLPAGVDNLYLEGGANAYATGNGGNNIITGNAGTDILTTGGGNDILVAGTGADTFVISAAAGATTWIEGFKTSGAATDTLDLGAFGFTSFAAAQAAMVQAGSNVEISLGGDQLVMLQNQQLANLSANNVHITFTPAALHLSFDDEFNSLSLNMGTPATAGGTWTTYYSGFGIRTLTSNNEQELDVDPSYAGTAGAPLGLNPFSDQNGVVTITAAPAPAADLPYLSGYQYTSGMLNTQNSFSQTYGYFEMRAELPAGGQGLWPAFWLLPENNSWPPEIDVVEQVNGATTNIFSTLHDNSGDRGTNLNVGDTSAGFHTYGVLWTPQTLDYYFDGRDIFSTPTPADMDSPEYMLMDLAVGGDWPGSPDATTNWALANMKIDYVRAYSLTPTANSAPTLSLSNALNPASDPTAFTVPALSANTASTYTASQLGISGIDPTTSVTVATNANDDLTVTNNSAWGSINNVAIASAINGIVTLSNFVDAGVTMGNGDSQITVNDAMRGAITVGNGDDVITVTAESNATSNNVMTINAGDGADHIGFLGASNAVAAITAGNGGNTITIDGQAAATVVSGVGNDDFIDKSTGLVSLTGGDGSDVFEFLAGAHATITDFKAVQDSLVLYRVTPSQTQVATSGGNTFISWGSGSQVELTGVSLAFDQIHFNFG